MDIAECAWCAGCAQCASCASCAYYAHGRIVGLLGLVFFSTGGAHVFLADFRRGAPREGSEKSQKAAQTSHRIRRATAAVDSKRQRSRSTTNRRTSHVFFRHSESSVLLE